MADIRSFPSAHPDEATFERLALDEVGAGERAALFDHITACPSCARVWRGLLALRAEAETEQLIAPAVHTARRWRSPVLTLAVAATLVAAISGVILNRRGSHDTTTLRGSDTATVGDLSATIGSDGRPALAWSPTAAATRYRVAVFSEDGQEVWTREVAAPPVAWPAEVPRPNGAYRWRVEALTPNGVVARSRLAELEIER
jgi:hypothetical protein